MLARWRGPLLSLLTDRLNNLGRGGDLKRESEREREREREREIETEREREVAETWHGSDGGAKAPVMRSLLLIWADCFPESAGSRTLPRPPKQPATAGVCEWM